MSFLDSILDPIDQALGVGQRGTTSNPLEALTRTIQKAPQIADLAKATTFAMGGAGDLAGYIGGLTGKDPLSGQDMKAWERGLMAAGIAGVGIAGMAMKMRQGEHLVHTVGATYRRPQFAEQPRFRVETDNYAVGVRPFPGGERITSISSTPSEIAGLNQKVPNQDLLWGTTKRFTNQVLEVGNDEVTWSARTAQVLLNGSTDDAQIAGVQGFLEQLGERLMGENIAHSVAQVQDRSEGARNAASWEVSRFQAAIDQKLFSGNQLKQAQKAWKRLRNGDALSPEEYQLLGDSVVGFSNAVWWVDHPELALNPFVGIKKINLDDGTPTVTLKSLQFSSLPLDRVSERELNNRVSQVFQTNPTAMVDPMARNIRVFYDRYVTPEGVRKWREWYPQARIEIDDLAGRLTAQGYQVDTKQLVTLASILSGGEQWETNVAKAGVIVKAIRDSDATGARSVAAVLREAHTAGVKVSEDDVIRSLLALSMDDPLAFFRTGKVGRGAKTLKDLGRMWEEGGDPKVLAALRKMPEPHQALKQDSFAYGISESLEADLEQQAELMSKILTGAFGALEGQAPYSDLRRALPVVVDRQAFKVALGFSLVPGTYLSGQKGVFDAMAQAYRLAAADIGEIDGLGRMLLPEELQAITWMQFREEARVLGTRKLPEPTSGWRNRSKRGVASYAAGHGPDFIFDDTVLRQLTGNAEVLPFGGVDAVDYGTDYSRFKVKAKDLNDPAKPNKKGNWREHTLKVEADGTVKVLSPDVTRELAAGKLRGRWPTRVKVDGEYVWAPVRPAYVDDVNAVFDDWANSTYQVDAPMKAGRTGGSIHPQGAPQVWLEPGHHMVIGSPADLQGYSGSLAHDRLAAELRREGVSFTYKVNEHGHTGLSSPKELTLPDGSKTLLWDRSHSPVPLSADEWDSLPFVVDREKRIGAVFSFETPDDMAKAEAYLSRQANPNVANRAAESYVQQYGQQLGLAQQKWVPSTLQADPERGRQMAEFYRDAPDFDPAAEPSYRALATEIDAQYDFLENTLGITVEFVPNDPYASHADMVADVIDNKRLKVLDTRSHLDGPEDGFHPFLTVDQNNKFRAIHDFFGHAAQENSFSRDGEEIAWALHSQMFSEAARPAMTAETRLQNSYLNFLPENVKLKAETGAAEFGPQKVVLPPQEFVDLPHIDYPDGPGTNGFEIYREQVLERTFYTDGPDSAPGGTKPLIESRWRDSAGRELVNLNEAGDPHRSNSTTVWVPSDYASFVTPTRVSALDPGAGGTVLSKRNGRWMVAGQAVVHDAGDRTISRKSGAKQALFGVAVSAPKGKPKAADRFVMFLPEGDLPVVSYGAAGLEPADIPGALPERTFTVTKTSKGIQVKPMVDDVDGILASEVGDLLVRMGADQRIDFADAKTGKVHRAMFDPRSNGDHLAAYKALNRAFHRDPVEVGSELHRQLEVGVRDLFGNDEFKVVLASSEAPSAGQAQTVYEFLEKATKDPVVTKAFNGVEFTDELGSAKAGVYHAQWDEGNLLINQHALPLWQREIDDDVYADANGIARWQVARAPEHNIIHEVGHRMLNEMLARKTIVEVFRPVEEAFLDNGMPSPFEAIRLGPKDRAVDFATLEHLISTYAMHSTDEFFAETFTLTRTMPEHPVSRMLKPVYDEWLKELGWS